MELAALRTDIAGTLTPTAELGARADVLVPQVTPVVRCLVHTPPTANVEKVTVTSSVTRQALFTRELAVPRMDGVATQMLTVELAAKAGVMVQAVVLVVVLELPLQLQRHLELKNLYWVRLRVRRRMAPILLTVLAAPAMGILFVVNGQTVVVVLFMG